VDRWYLVTIPALYDCERTSPVILSFHGGAQNASQQLELSQLSDEKFNSFAFAVYPQGIDNTWQGVPSSTADDLSFTSDLLNQLEKNYNIDSQRIWATGKSDGAGFCNLLACDFTMSRRIAAFAPVSGTYFANTKTCDAEKVIMKCNAGRRKIPMIAFHGAKDEVAAYAGGESQGQCSPSIPQFIRNWAMRDGLGLTNLTTSPRQDTTVTKFGRDLETGMITLVLDKSIGHEWPSTTPNIDNTQEGRHVATFEATEIIVNFFKRHSLSTPVNIVIQPREVSGINSPTVLPYPTATTTPAVHTTIPVAPTSTPPPAATSGSEGSAPSSSILPASAGNKMIASTGLLAFFFTSLAMVL